MLLLEILDIIHSNIELDVKMEIIEKIKMIILKHRANSSIILEKSFGILLINSGFLK